MSAIEACDEVKDPNGPKDNYELSREAEASIRKQKEDAYREKIKGFMMNIEYGKREIKKLNEKIEHTEKQLEEMKSVNINDMEIYAGSDRGCCEVSQKPYPYLGDIAKKCC
jgi:septin family protein